MDDKAGVAFDPEIHFVKDGKGVLTKEGLWRKRSGTKKPGGENSLLARLEALEKAAASKDARIAELEAANVKIQEAAQDLGKAQVADLTPPPGEARLIPYKGAVKAIFECFVGQFYKAGSVFFVDVPVLWTDDPYVPVLVTGQNEDGEHLTEANPLAPTPVDYRFRLRSHDVLSMADSQPQVRSRALS
jgi:hypothetical protein